MVRIYIELFVPLASMMGELVTMMQSLFNKNGEVKVIGTRHGEKLFETLVSREEIARAQDLGDYCRIPADSRENCAKYFNESERMFSNADNYISHYFKQLTMPEVV